MKKLIFIITTLFVSSVSSPAFAVSISNPASPINSIYDPGGNLLRIWGCTNGRSLYIYTNIDGINKGNSLPIHSESSFACYNSATWWFNSADYAQNIDVVNYWQYIAVIESATGSCDSLSYIACDMIKDSKAVLNIINFDIPPPIYFGQVQVQGIFTKLITDAGGFIFFGLMTLIGILASLLGLGFAIRHLIFWITGGQAGSDRAFKENWNKRVKEFRDNTE